MGMLINPYLFGGPAPMVVTTQSGSGNNVNSRNITLPTSVSVGNLLVLFVTLGAGSARTLTQPSGWSTLYDVSGPAGIRRVTCFYKIADGSEGSTVTVNASGNCEWAWNVYNISGHNAGNIVASSAATGFGTSPHPNSVTAAWGNDTLYLALSSQQPAQASAGTLPSGYSSAVFGTQGNGTSVSLLSGQKTDDPATESPGVFTISSADWHAMAVAIG